MTDVIKTTIKGLFLLGLVLPLLAYAESPRDSFKSVISVPQGDNIVPEVFEVEVPRFLESKIIGVFDTTDETFEPHYLIEKRTKSLVPLQISTKEGRSLREVNDKKYSTFATFPARLDGGVVYTTLVIRAASPVNSTSISLQLDNNVSNPLTVAISAGEGVGEEVVISERAFSSRTITFPETSSTVWTVRLKHVQPLRIAELELKQKDAEQDLYRAVRFLAQPEHEYLIYIDGDRYVDLNAGESSNLRDNEGVVTVNGSSKQINPLYSPSDSDEDGVADTLDNCVQISNPNQEDVDGNGRGDACDDYDRDGVVNISDNCINEPNRYQKDEDGDGIGDVCDGEESRITEKYGWLPWVGIIGVLIALITLFAVTIVSIRKQKEASIEKEKEEEQPQMHEVPMKNDSHVPENIESQEVSEE